MIRYKRVPTYKYKLYADYSIKTNLIGHEVHENYLALTDDGLLTIRKDYAWDGPSGPAIDTKNFMRGSLVHDALYQLMRERRIPQDKRKYADQLLVEICRQDGMSKVRAWWVYNGVRVGAAAAAKPDLLTAP